MTVENKALAFRYFKEIMNEANLDTLNEIISPDFVFTLATHPEPYHGPEGFQELVSMLHGAFPDFYIEPQDVVADGDTVVTRWVGGGTHLTGPIQTSAGEIPPTGRAFKIDGMTWHRMRDGKIVESLANEDTVGMLTQLGVLPGADATAAHGDGLSLARRYFDEVMSQGRLEVIDEILTPDFAFNIPTQPEPIRGEAFKGFVQYLRSAFPDIKFTVEREIQEGAKVAARWSIEGTHQGEFLGAEPTGAYVKDYGIDIFRLEGDRIAEVHVNENDFGLFKQLGMIPS